LKINPSDRIKRRFTTDASSNFRSEYECPFKQNAVISQRIHEKYDLKDDT
jgi:hypothetical protein